MACTTLCGSAAHLPVCVQFAYGEDGVDVTDTAYLTKFDFAAANAPALADKLALAKHQQGGLTMQPDIQRNTRCVHVVLHATYCCDCCWYRCG